MCITIASSQIILSHNLRFSLALGVLFNNIKSWNQISLCFVRILFLNKNIFEAVSLSAYTGTLVYTWPVLAFAFKRKERDLEAINQFIWWQTNEKYFHMECLVYSFPVLLASPSALMLHRQWLEVLAAVFPPQPDLAFLEAGKRMAIAGIFIPSASVLEAPSSAWCPSGAVGHWRGGPRWEVSKPSRRAQSWKRYWNPTLLILAFPFWPQEAWYSLTMSWVMMCPHRLWAAKLTNRHLETSGNCVPFHVIICLAHLNCFNDEEDCFIYPDLWSGH